MPELQAYPLCWPEGWPRTKEQQRESSRFRVTPDAARYSMLEEIRRLVGSHIFRRSDVIISTNIRLRQDGEPYASQRPPEDKGVAVYFKYKDRPMVFACDRWLNVHDNMQSIAKTIEALRGIERWGASDMMERAFTGFLALEHNPIDDWRHVLKMGNRLPNETNQDELDAAERHYKILAKDAHPDTGGSHEEMRRLNKARDQARRVLGNG